MLIQIMILLVAALAGFLLKILHSRLTEKKVSLIYALDKPADFTPPPVWFQKLRIWNKGNLSARSLLVNLSPNIEDFNGFDYDVDTEDPYEVQKTSKAYTLKFESLRPKDDLTISLKFNVKPPDDLLLSVKSDEGIAHSVEREANLSDKLAYANLGAILLLVASTAFLGYTIYTRIDSQNRLQLQSPLEVTFSYRNHPYDKGEKMTVKGEARNTVVREVLRDSVLMLKIPGLSLDYDTWYQKKELLRAGERFTFEKTIPLSKDMPSGKYAVRIDSMTNTLENSFWSQTTGSFDVR